MTCFKRLLFIVPIFWMFLNPGAASAQGFGGFGGAGSSTSRPTGNELGGFWHSELSLLPPENALNFITIDGTAEARIAPEEIRVVLAVTSEAETAVECQEKNAAQLQAVVRAWAGLKISEENIIQDFINILPVYEWRLSDRDGQQVRVQQQEGYRMQSNLHVSVKSERDAMAAINHAFKQGVTDIVTFDYWSAKLDEEKVKARAAAMEAAKEKSKVMLSVFAEQPKVINIQERTAVFFPSSLYRTYENILEEEVQYDSTWHSKPAIKAYRPKMTYFQGLQSQSDVRPPGAAMRPAIAVVSTVRIYYQSPADKTVIGKSNRSTIGSQRDSAF